MASGHPGGGGVEDEKMQQGGDGGGDESILQTSMGKCAFCVFEALLCLDLMSDAGRRSKNKVGCFSLDRYFFVIFLLAESLLIY